MARYKHSSGATVKAQPSGNGWLVSTERSPVFVSDAEFRASHQPISGHALMLLLETPVVEVAPAQAPVVEPVVESVSFTEPAPVVEPVAEPVEPESTEAPAPRPSRRRNA